MGRTRVSHISFNGKSTWPQHGAALAQIARATASRSASRSGGPDPAPPFDSPHALETSNATNDPTPNVIRFISRLPSPVFADGTRGTARCTSVRPSASRALPDDNHHENGKRVGSLRVAEH